VRDPCHAIPLHGTFIGFPSEHLGMEVQISVTTGTPEAIWAAPQRSTWPQRSQPALGRGQGKFIERVDIR
jgi:hypothetical protein